MRCRPATTDMEAVVLTQRMLANQVRAVEKSREHWKEVAKEARKLAAHYQRELEQLKQPAAARSG